MAEEQQKSHCIEASAKFRLILSLSLLRSGPFDVPVP